MELQILHVQLVFAVPFQFLFFFSDDVNSCLTKQNSSNSKKIMMYNIDLSICFTKFIFMLTCSHFYFPSIGCDLRFLIYWKAVFPISTMIKLKSNEYLLNLHLGGSSRSSWSVFINFSSYLKYSMANYWNCIRRIHIELHT